MLLKVLDISHYLDLVCQFYKNFQGAHHNENMVRHHNENLIRIFLPGTHFLLATSLICHANKTPQPNVCMLELLINIL